MSFQTAQRLGKRWIDYPETVVPVASSAEYVERIFKNPGSKVCYGDVLSFLNGVIDTSFLLTRSGTTC